MDIREIGKLIDSLMDDFIESGDDAMACEKPGASITIKRLPFDYEVMFNGVLYESAGYGWRPAK